jgi:hypothetical protein
MGCYPKKPKKRRIASVLLPLGVPLERFDILHHLRIIRALQQRIWTPHSDNF